MPEQPAAYVRLPVKGQAGKHSGHNIRTKTISKKQGIKGLYCVQCKTMITFLFAKKSGWTMGRARTWMKSHKFVLAMFDEDGQIGFGHFDESGEMTEFMTSEQLAEAIKPDEKKPEDLSKFMDEERLIFLFGGVGSFSAEAVCKRLLFYDKADRAKPIKLAIASYGGDLYSSFAITDMMEYIQAPVETIGIGMVMSGGLLIFMAGDKRHISQTSSILSHRFWTFKHGSQAELKADAVEDKLCHQRMIDHYIKFTNLEDKKEVEANLLKETNVWLTPEQAMEFSLADDYFDSDLADSEVQESWKEFSGKDTDEHKETISEPYPNEHACRLEDPGKYDTCRRGTRIAHKPESVNGKKYSVIYCKKKGGSMEQQAFRYPKKTWTAGQARAHCKLNKGAFEAARLKETTKDGDGVMIKGKTELNKVTTKIFESIKSLEWIEGDGGEPFRFSGIAFEADAESANKRFYPLNVVRAAVDIANENIDDMTIEMGHPKNDDDTSPENIIGNMIEYDMNEENEVTFVGELNNTRLGLDGQELIKSRPLGAQALSLRAGGDLANEKAPDGHRRKRVIEMDLLGLDLVKTGGFKKAKVSKIGEANTGGEDDMTKEEMVKTEEFKELAEEIKEGFTKQVGDEKDKVTALEDENKKLKTELAGEKQAKEDAEKKFDEKELAEYKDAEIAKLEVTEKVKELLEERVSGDDQEGIKASIKDELDYIDKVAPILKEGVKIKIPPKGKDLATKEKTDEEVLKKGSEASYKEIEERKESARKDMEDND